MRLVSMGSAAAELEISQRALMAKLREIKWVNRDNQPFIEIRMQGLMHAKQNYYRNGEGHPMPCRRKTPYLTRAGMTQLKLIVGAEEMAQAADEMLTAAEGLVQAAKEATR